MQNGSGRALRRRTAVSSDPACGAPAQTAHNLEHGEKQRADDPPNGLLSGNGLEKGNGFGVGLKSGNKSELGHLTGESAIKREPDGSFEVEDELGDGVEGGNGFRKPLKGDATEEGGSLLSIEQTLFLEERVTVKGGALETEEEHWEEGFGHAAPSSTGPSGLAFASWSGQVAIETGDEEEGLGKPRAKPALRRATARDKEFAALVHKAHLLCLLARGMRFDGASEDPLLQASLLSCTPEALGSLSQKGDVIKGPELAPLVEWFQERFRILEGAEGRNGNEGVELSGWESDAERLQRVLEKRGGTAEELTALFVALCRALGLTTRWGSISFFSNDASCLAR